MPRQEAGVYLELAVSRWLEKAEPAMEATMKQAKIMPWGICSLWGARAGVHKNTNVYMDPSNSDCMAPSSAIFWSARTLWPVSKVTAAAWSTGAEQAELQGS